MRRRILVAVDGSEVFDRSLTRAAELARVLDAELHTITVKKQRPAFETIAMEVELPQAELDRYFSEVEYQIRRAAEEAGIRIASTKIIKGNPANEILRYIREASFDFVVLGRRNRRRGNYFRLGSTVRKVAAHAPCTIVLVPKWYRRPDVSGSGALILVKIWTAVRNREAYINRIMSLRSG